MIIFPKKDISIKKQKALRRFLADRQIEVKPVLRKNRTLLVVMGKFGQLAKRDVEKHESVDFILKSKRPYKLAGKNFRHKTTKVKLNNKITIGNSSIVIIAGPCSVETKKQIREIAREVKMAGCHALRGGAYKPRTAPYDFQGLGKIGLHFLKQAAKENNLAVVTEVLDVRQVELVDRYTDVFQVGARNMQNYPLLKELGKAKKPVLFKRGMWASYKEFLLAAEYILLEGNDQVILCERGIRTHVPETRFTLDLNAVAFFKKESHLPVIVDPSHGTGRASMVKALSRAAIAAGADGLIIETHNNPRHSWSDAEQAISTKELEKVVCEVKNVAKVVGRK